MSDVAGPSMTPPAVSIVIPVNNEADNIGPLTEEIRAAMAGGPPFELIYVNDGSTDRTPAIIGALKSNDRRIRMISHDVACGQSVATRSGVHAARGEIIVKLDGDGQNDPKYIPAMIEALERGGASVGLANSVRMGRKDTGFKRWQSRIANRIRAAILKDETPDTGSGLKAFRRGVYLDLPFFDSQHRYMPALVLREGLGLVQVEVVDRPRLHGSTHYGFWNRFWVGIFDLACVWWLIKRRKRLPRISEQ